jgi:hypothetical protein
LILLQRDDAQQVKGMEMPRLDSESLLVQRPGFLESRLLMEHERLPKRSLNASRIVSHHREYLNPPNARPLNCHGRLLQFDFNSARLVAGAFATTEDASFMAGGHSGGAAACGPSDAELAFQRALSLRRQGQGLLADEHCAEALQLDPAQSPYVQMHERAVRGEAPAAFAVDRTLQP